MGSTSEKCFMNIFVGIFILNIQKSLNFNLINCRFAKGNIDEKVKGGEGNSHSEIYDDG